MNGHYPLDWLANELRKAAVQLGNWSSQRGPRGYRIISEAHAAGWRRDAQEEEESEPYHKSEP